MEKMGKKNKYAVGIILYKPSKDDINNLINYKNIFEHIYIYDNSDINNYANIMSVLGNKQVTYFYNGMNEGISIPFNRMIAESKKINCDFFLMMDQDSIFDLENISILKSIIDKNTDLMNAMFCPNIYFNGSQKDEIEYDTNVKFCITSGSFVNVDIFLEIGGYDEKLFIDGVDREFCIKLIDKGYGIKKIKKSIMYQSLGDKEKNLLGIYEHSPIRNYYIYRNRLYVIKKYPQKFKGLLKIKSLYLSQMKQIISIFLFETSKFEKLRFIKKAKLDFKKNKMGKIKED